MRRGRGHRLLGSFNTQPPEGGWSRLFVLITQHLTFQHTAARRRLAARWSGRCWIRWFQHTAARRRLVTDIFTQLAGGQFQHTAARRRLDCGVIASELMARFQHTAARRRLVHRRQGFPYFLRVSTHSRPKAAGIVRNATLQEHRRFNTQPPEGGWGHRQAGF